jgi:hypothetical protein
MSQLTLNSALGGTFTVAPPNVIGTVVATLPSTSGTLAYVNAAQTFTGLQTFDTLTTTGNVILGNASTDTINVGNCVLVKDASGNVGIGTANPASVGSYQSLLTISSPNQSVIALDTVANGLATIINGNGSSYIKNRICKWGGRSNPDLSTRSEGDRDSGSRIVKQELKMIIDTRYTPFTNTSCLINNITARRCIE